MPRIYVDFENLKDGRKAVEELKDRGYKDAHLDAVDHFLDEFAEEMYVGDIPCGPSISAMVRPSGNNISDKGPLMRMDPMVTGMGSFSEAGALNTRLRVTVSPDKVGEVKGLLKNMGGT